MKRRKYNNPNDLFNVEIDYGVQIRKHVDILCSCLTKGNEKQHSKIIPVFNHVFSRNDVLAALKRIRGPNRSATRPSTHKYVGNSRLVGSVVNRNYGA